MNKWSEAETALNKALHQIDARIRTIEMMLPSEHMSREKADMEEARTAVLLAKKSKVYKGQQKLSAV